ncbi:DUF4148 domain-containing protein [Paraburkholderia sp. J12]|uniref:DUF4148 domain-containing protein n=1 Tax=Paraburkholderia sp. J12 TaxID=2805432 RepID=UPI002ABE2411|nr:DUF4148 domain-containing protein [Paraburkholderia sp. J12]
MKRLLYASVMFAVSVAPMVSFAQSSKPLTRAQVIADLIAVENAGFHPGSVDYVEYPGNLQAAEARVAAKQTQNAAVPSARGPSQ